MKLKVKVEETVFEVEINDLEARPIVALVDGLCFEVWPEAVSVPAAAPAPAFVKPVERPAAPAARRVEPAIAAGDVDKSRVILAPIPGVILSVAVGEGASVSVGQEVCVLEAMKMKNVIRAQRSGKVAAVRVANGDHVKHGQILIELAD
jgi:glutaconyl-CoA/methylmalonyl-CoA decarboxylase subunit gamma